MKCELFSMLSSIEEVEELNSDVYRLLSELKGYRLDLAYKTEIKLDEQCLENALISVSSSEDKPEIIFMVNTLSTTDNSSFIELLGQIITNRDEQYGTDTVIQSLGDFGNGMLGFYFVYNDVKVVVLPQSNISGNSVFDMVMQSVTILLEKNYLINQDRQLNQQTDNDDIDNANNKKFNGKYTNRNKSKKKDKKPFLQTLIPQKGDTKSVVISKILTIVFSLLFIVSAVLLVNELWFKSIKNQKDIEELYSKSNYSGRDNPYDGEYSTDLRSKDWQVINSTYPDIIGWVQINNTNINYPVLYSKEKDSNGNSYYLYRNYKKESTKYGSIFMDSRNLANFENKVSVLHGHHMIDGSMFSDLVNYGRYSGVLDFYKKASVVNIETSEGVTRWQVFSVIKTTIDVNDSSFFDYCDVNFASDEEFMEYIYKAKVRSLFNVPIKINENDKIIALSTCSYEYDNFRTVVFARQLREGESPTLSTNQTTLNSNPLWPDKYYSSTGLYKPSYSDFASDYRNGKISWYDGNLYN